jgi:hypothetical protein
MAIQSPDYGTAISNVAQNLLSPSLARGAGSALGRYLGGTRYGRLYAPFGGYAGSALYNILSGRSTPTQALTSPLSLAGLGGSIGSYFGSKYGPLGAGFGNIAGQLGGYGVSRLAGNAPVSMTGGIGNVAGTTLGGYLGRRYGLPGTLIGSAAGGLAGRIAAPALSNAVQAALKGTDIGSALTQGAATGISNIGASLPSLATGIGTAGLSYLLSKEGAQGASTGLNIGSGLGGLATAAGLGSYLGPVGAMAGLMIGSLYDTLIGSSAERKAGRKERAAETQMLQETAPAVKTLAEYITTKKPEEYGMDWETIEKLNDNPTLRALVQSAMIDPQRLMTVGGGAVHERTVDLPDVNLGSFRDYNPFVSPGVGRGVLAGGELQGPQDIYDPHTNVPAGVNVARLSEMLGIPVEQLTATPPYEGR